jgi:hypothetical protein
MPQAWLFSKQFMPPDRGSQLHLSDLSFDRFVATRMQNQARKRWNIGHLGLSPSDASRRVCPATQLGVVNAISSDDDNSGVEQKQQQDYTRSAIALAAFF